LNLDNGSAYAALVNVSAAECANPPRTYVVPGSPSTSYLMDTLQGTNLCAGTRMPPGGPYLSAAEVQTLADWICEGAPNN
jgi:hypothetical protein